MELELQQDYINCLEHTEQLLEKEETTEMIVPDACPDIAELLDSEGCLYIRRKQAEEGRIDCAGKIQVTVLYRPDDDPKLRTLEIPMPFHCSVEASGVTGKSEIVAEGCIRTVDVRVLNPRKILVRVVYALKLSCYAPKTIGICSGIAPNTAYDFRQKLDTYTSYLTCGVEEKKFNYTDTLTLPANRPNAAELLRTTARCCCNEARMIGNKLVMKGEAVLGILYRAEDGTLSKAEFTLPFSQIMDVAEAKDCQLRVMFTDVKCALEGERNFEVELEFLAAAVLRREEEQAILTDLYSTTYETETVSQTYELEKLLEDESSEVMSTLLETETPIHEILDVQVRGQGGWTVFVLFEREDGGVEALHGRVDYEGECDDIVTETPTAVMRDNGIEVRFGVLFHRQTLEKTEMQGVERAALDETKMRAHEGKPSVVVRGVRVGECLWDLAKCYATTDTEIMEANDLSDSELYPGQVLLIPNRWKAQHCASQIL